MKKLFMVGIAVMMCFALALPAAAQVKVSGGVCFLGYYMVGSPETNPNSQVIIPGVPGFVTEGTPAEVASMGNINNIDGRSSLQFNLTSLLTNIMVTYTNEKGTYGATAGIAGGQINNYSSNSLIEFTSSYMWWMIMPDVKVSIGKISQFIGGLGPSSIIEANEYKRATSSYGYPNPISGTPVAGLTSFGNLAGESIPGISIDIKVNDMVSVILGLYDPDADGSPNISLLPAPNISTISEETSIPRLDIAIPIKWGKFYIQPVGSYLKQKFSNVSPTCENELTTWLIGASGSVKLGPVTLSGEYIHGKNIGDGNYSGPGSNWSIGTATTYVDSAGHTRIGEMTENAWWVQARWQTTPKIAIQAAYGKWRGTNDNNPTVATDDGEFYRSGWVANVWYSIAPNFFVIPSYSHLNLGHDMNFEWDGSATARWSFGTIDMYGVAFFMVF